MSGATAVAARVPVASARSAGVISLLAGVLTAGATTRFLTTLGNLTIAENCGAGARGRLDGPGSHSDSDTAPSAGAGFALDADASSRSRAWQAARPRGHRCAAMRRARGDGRTG